MSECTVGYRIYHIKGYPPVYLQTEAGEGWRRHSFWLLVAPGPAILAAVSASPTVSAATVTAPTVPAQIGAALVPA